MRHPKQTPTRVAPPGKDAGKHLVHRLDGSQSLDTAAATSVPPDDAVELRIGILLWPRFPLLSLAGLCDALRHAADLGDQSRQVRCSWSVLGLPGTRITASSGVEIPVQEALDSGTKFDYIAVIGGLLPFMDDVEPHYLAFLRRADEAGVPLIGICTGTFVLARAGLMKDQLACIHPFHVDDWKRMFPKARFATNCDYVFDGPRISCAGGVSIIELATELIRVHCGPDRAAKVVHQMSVSQRSSSSHIARRHALGYASADNEKLRQAIILMEKNLSIPLEISVIAKLVNSSSRQLERVFLAETGASPSEFYRNSRLKYGRWLLTTTDSTINDIAFECGFSDAAHFIRHFQQCYGVAPGRLRKALTSTGTRVPSRSSETSTS
ncbi:GlxA family transcriptional regulator [Hylemonella gracilis]|uniref:GlxA family transcriptional regulator n=1 Tax=Hylemonella gracilis TaxID=80880 RepID=A0A4P6UH73_9BURK|nr:GlxA family transcriptional regulator [Hylemonella gracilis]QBK04243.1 GlxA family transcriptional regulator [Hylemonella gracilis]